MIALKRLLAAFMLLVASSAIMAEPVVKIESRYYPVQGMDIASIYQSLQKEGPNGERGKTYHAHTEWDIKWSYRWIESSSICRLTQIDVSIDIGYLLPQLSTIDQLDAATRQSWDHFYQALLKHEQHHKDFGIKAAHELEQTLLDEQPQPCFGMQNKLSDLAQKVVDKYDAMEKAFDLRTNHGINDGVVLQ